MISVQDCKRMDMRCSCSESMTFIESTYLVKSCPSATSNLNSFSNSSNSAKRNFTYQHYFITKATQEYKELIS